MRLIVYKENEIITKYTPEVSFRIGWKYNSSPVHNGVVLTPGGKVGITTEGSGTQRIYYIYMNISMNHTENIHEGSESDCKKILQYIQDRFESSVELENLEINVPKILKG